MTTAVAVKEEFVEKVFQANAKKLADSNSDVVAVRNRVGEILKTVNKNDVIASLGGDHKPMMDYADKLLSQVKSQDLEVVGEKLNEVVVLAKGINVGHIIEGKSKIPIIGGLIAKFSDKKEKLLGKYNSLSGQIEKLMTEVSVSQNRLSSRITDMEKLYDFNTSEYYDLDCRVLAGEVIVLEVQAEIDAFGEVVDSMNAQQVADLRETKTRLEKRINDLKTMQVVAVQTAPMIRMVQQNNQLLIDKFRNLKELTIPSWKKQFTLAIALMEQKKAVELTQKIDDATNDLLKANAELLKQNSISTAKANQRAVVDIETLEHVQRTLIETVEEVQKIKIEGEQKRKDAEVKMVGMKEDLVKRLSGRA